MKPNKRMRQAIIIIVLPLFFIAVGCDSKQTPTPQDAEGPTTIRFVVCASGPADCSVTARFRYFDSCERYKEFMDLLCSKRDHTIYLPARTREQDDKEIGRAHV